MPWRFLSEREGKRGGELVDPFMNPECNVELEVPPEAVLVVFA